MKHQGKRILSLCIILTLLLLLVGCAGQKNATVQFEFVVTHSDGSVKTFQIETDAANLADALKAESLVRESESAGLYNTVDGETASWDDGEQWWKFSLNGEELAVGIDSITPANGDTVEAVFTVGFGG